jgi:hypothetical protein
MLSVAQAADLSWALVWILTFIIPSVLSIVLIINFRRHKRSFAAVVGGIISVVACAYLTWLLMLPGTNLLHQALSMPAIQHNLTLQCGENAIADWGQADIYWEDSWWTWESSGGWFSCGTWIYLFHHANSTQRLWCSCGNSSF